jgi:hypothetical protein
MSKAKKTVDDEHVAVITAVLKDSVLRPELINTAKKLWKRREKEHRQLLQHLRTISMHAALFKDKGEFIRGLDGVFKKTLAERLKPILEALED